MAVRTSTHPFRRLAVALSMLLLSVSAPVLAGGTADAQAVEEVDLLAYVSGPEVPVAGAPARMSFGVNNLRLQTATGITLQLLLPPSATIEPIAGCTVATTTSATVVTCDVPDLAANVFGFAAEVTFGSVGTYELIASATADQPDVDGDSTSSHTAVVIDEEADLAGYPSTEIAPAGGRLTIQHEFYNIGPTSAGQATVEGTFPAGSTLVSGSFHFGDYDENLAGEQCTISTTAFSCGPLHTRGLSPVVQRIRYEVELPQTLGTVVASATITGRNDPDHANDTSTTTIEVRAAAAELWVWVEQPVGPWYGVQTLAVPVHFGNQGETAAEDVAVTVDAPPGWTADVPADADPPGRACTATPDGATVTCTYDEVHPLDGELTVAPRLTSPTGPPATGTVTVTLTTATPEHGDVPNTVSFTVHSAKEPGITVSPATDLLDGQEVAVELVGYPAASPVYLVQCEAGPASPADCDLATLRTPMTDDAGSLAATMTVDRLIITDAGQIDCAVDACSVVAATTDLVLVREASISFADVPLPPSALRVTLDGPAFTDGDSRRATVSATLECDEQMVVSVQLDLEQTDTGGTVTGAASSYLPAVPCTPGEPVSITSDLMSGFDPGPATVRIFAQAGDERAVASGTIELEPFSAVLAQLQARLADPDDTTVVPELLAGFAFRLQYNPIFAHDFWVAILNA